MHTLKTDVDILLKYIKQKSEEEKSLLKIKT